MSLSFEISRHELRFLRPAGTSRGVYTTREIRLIRLRQTLDSITCEGLGECAPLPGLSKDEFAPGYDERLAAFAESVCSTGRIEHEAMREYPSMLFGLETAMLRLRAKSEALFDTPFSRGEDGIPINGLIWMGNADYMNEQIERKIEQGSTCIKIKIGAIDFDSELEILRSIRSRFSPLSLELRVDANGAFSPHEVHKKLDALAAFSLHSIEQPIPAGQSKHMARLCSISPIPIALDEELIGVNQAADKQELLDFIKPRYIVIKPSLHGAMHGGEEWIRLAEERGIGHWITSALESNVGLNAIAQWTAHIHPHGIGMHQGLGTGALFENNFPSPLNIIGEKLYYGNAQR